MTEKVSFTTKDHLAVAMENAYSLAVRAIPAGLSLERRLAAVANLTWMLFDAMVRGATVKPAEIKVLLETER